MTQVKLWQIVSQTVNGIVFADKDGNVVTLPQGGQGQVLVINAQGVPEWVDNAALSTALSAKTDATNALNTAKAYADAQIAALVDNAPVALNTLNELAVKLNGEDSAINALLLQVDGKAEKTEVVTSVAQAKQDAIQTAQDNTNVAVGNALNDVASQIAVARGDLQTYADQVATAKSDSAKSEAISTANGYTDQAISQLATTAANDATTKADKAKTTALSEANAYTDNAVNAALASTAQSQADAARDAAITASAQSIEQAKVQATNDAKAYTNATIDALPGRLMARTTATACFLMSTNGVNPQGGLPLANFTEVTGANLSFDSQITPKLLFVNGLAMSSDWLSENGTLGDTKIALGGKLRDHAFDGTDNTIMVLCEYTNSSTIYARPEPVVDHAAPMQPIDPIMMS
ncbi:MAG: hypothetical protein JST06_08975 [Bacteroidetes bacterium]|nr:hypothetical protein [Bacteroidota bacterium]MBS1628689.1 hypothetical protein [Bacteroidota bacterium]